MLGNKQKYRGMKMKKEKIKVALMGAGGRGRLGLLRTVLTCPEAEVVAVCDLYQDRIELAQKMVEEKHGNTPVGYTDYHELLKDDNVEAVIIASSWDEHIRMAVAAMKAGKFTAEIGRAHV